MSKDCRCHILVTGPIYTDDRRLGAKDRVLQIWKLARIGIGAADSKMNIDLTCDWQEFCEVIAVLAEQAFAEMERED